MASVYKRKYRPAPKDRTKPWADDAVEGELYTVAFVDKSDPTRDRGIQRRVPGYATEPASEELGRALDRLVSLRRGREPIPDELRRYLDGVPSKARSKLAKWGLLSMAAEAAKRGLSEHVAAYEDALRAGTASAKQKGRPATPGYVQHVGCRVRELLRRIGAKAFADIAAAPVARALRDLQAKGKRAKGIAPKTAAHYHGALFAFLEWCRRERLIVANPLADTAKPDGNAEKRHDRRALEPDEVQRVIAAATDGAECYAMTGATRALLWRFLAETGLRAGEARALVRADLALGERPAVNVRAENAKSRRARTVPLGAALANVLRTHTAALAPTARVFKLAEPEDLVKAWRVDLTDAQAKWLGEAATPKQGAEREQSDFLQYVDSAGRFADVHALRTTFATNLIAAGVDVKTAQALLGHASATMTLDVYARVFRGSDEAAIARLPSYDAPQREAAKCEGTHDAPAHCTKNWPNPGSPRGASVPRIAQQTPARESKTAFAERRDVCLTGSSPLGGVPQGPAKAGLFLVLHAFPGNAARILRKKYSSSRNP